MKSGITSSLMVIAIGLAAAPASYAQGCCGAAGTNQTAACSMERMAAVSTPGEPVAAPTGKSVFMQPVQAVYDGYIAVQGALAQDSLTGVSLAGTAMAKAIQTDSMKMLAPKVAQQAETLAKAKDLATARDAFKPLSDSLIQYLNAQNIPARTYYVAYCPMAKASWVQTDKTIMNPYMGKGMLHCGQIKH
jgi:hypothetical protein